MYYLVDKSLKNEKKQVMDGKTTRKDCGEDLRDSGKRFHSIKHYEDGKASRWRNLRVILYKVNDER